MRHILSVALVTSLAITASVAQDRHTPAKEDRLLRRFLATQFQIFTSNDSLKLGVNTEKPMANPGAPYNTDAVKDWNLPFQQLCFGGRSGSLWFLYYMESGFGNSWRLLLFKPRGRSILPLAVYELYSWTPLKTLDSLKEFVRATRVASSDANVHLKERESLIVVRSPSHHRIYFNASR